MTPNTASAESVLDSQRTMGQNIGTLLNLETHAELHGWMKQQERPNGDDESDKLDRDVAEPEDVHPEAGVGTSPVRVLSRPISRDNGHNEHLLAHTKRPLTDGKRGRRTKRNKVSSDVHIAKPTLVVVLKLTRGKGASDRAATMPPRQSPGPVSSTELDEIHVRRSTTLPSREDVVADDPETGGERTFTRPLVPDPGAAHGFSEVAMEDMRDWDDTIPAREASGSASFADESIQPPSLLLHQPTTTSQESNAQAMAEVRERLSSGEPYQLLEQIGSKILNKHTPRELVQHILVPMLWEILNRISTAAVRNSPTSMANDARERSTARVINPYQQESTPLEQRRQAQPVGRTIPLCDPESSHEPLVQTFSRADSVGDHLRNDRSDSAAATGSPGKKRAVLRDVAITNDQSGKSSSGPAPKMPETAAFKNSADAGPNAGFDYNRLVQDMNLTILFDRQDGSAPKQGNTISIKNIRNNSDLFGAIHIRSWWLDPDEEILRAMITEVGGRPTGRPSPEMWLLNGDTEDRSWGSWLSSLREFYEEEKVEIRMNLVARVFITRNNDGKGRL